VLLSPSKAHELIKEGAVRALANAGRMQPYTLGLPIHGRLRFPDKTVADAFRPSRAQRVDDYTFEALFESALDIHNF